MNEGNLTQEHINKRIKIRLHRERERLIKDFENRLKRCMASVHLILHTEMKDMKREVGTCDVLEENCNDT